MARSKRSGTCVYCGAVGSVTSDHVPPKCLFPSATRINLITVPACLTCNSSFKLDDEYFRLILSLRADLPEGPTATFLRAATKRSLRKPEAARLKASVLRSVEHRSIHSSGGIYLGDAAVMNVDYRRIDATASRVVKGLFAHVFGEPLPITHIVDIKFTELQKNTSAIEAPQIKELLTILGQSGVHHESNDTIEAWAKLAEDDNYSSFWYFRILKTVGFFAFTVPKDS